MSGAITLFHISDLHFGREDRRALDWVAQAIRSERPRAVAVTGDLTMRARPPEFRAACAWIGQLAAPVTVEPGNHDMPYVNLVERFAAPYRRFRAIEALLERQLDLGDLHIVPLQTVTRAQWRFPWVDGWVREPALAATLAQIDALPPGARVLVTAHHPLPERSTSGKRLTINGARAMAALAGRRVLGVLTGHVHDPFDLTAETPEGPLRMIGAGTLSQRVRSTPPSFNEIVVDGREVRVRVRNLEAVSTADMQVDAVPETALPPRAPGEPVAPVGAVPEVDPPEH
ncbi:metallophosphoesterase family protein [Novosphingobium piscinae]|uniref:Metallophosphoesterase n=1 Tax=Novosphingobium piscinae TaxID=1507448 RepID=A0A7X1KRA8_9SPHN|nr:metallophosphoesterase [Novosphingobium piscinae]MBC2670542.1 metallophosphoesterase [Novosphingobium piscinae]